MSQKRGATLVVDDADSKHELAKRQRMEIETKGEERRACARKPKFTINAYGQVFRPDGLAAQLFCRLSHKRVTLKELGIVHVDGQDWYQTTLRPDMEIHRSKTRIREKSTHEPVMVCITGQISVWQLLEEAWLSKHMWFGYDQLQQMKRRFPELDFQEEDVFKISPERRHGLYVIKFPDMFERFVDANKQVGLLTYKDERYFKCLSC